MKMITLLATLVASVFFITGCATQCNSPCAKDAPVHQDMKGETR